MAANLFSPHAAHPENFPMRDGRADFLCIPKCSTQSKLKSRLMTVIAVVKVVPQSVTSYTTVGSNIEIPKKM